jgi:hypothetical protein
MITKLVDFITEKYHLYNDEDYFVFNDIKMGLNHIKNIYGKSTPIKFDKEEINEIKHYLGGEYKIRIMGLTSKLLLTKNNLRVDIKKYKSLDNDNEYYLFSVYGGLNGVKPTFYETSDFGSLIKIINDL